MDNALVINDLQLWAIRNVNCVINDLADIIAEYARFTYDEMIVLLMAMKTDALPILFKWSFTNPGSLSVAQRSTKINFAPFTGNELFRWPISKRLKVIMKDGLCVNHGLWDADGCVEPIECQLAKCVLAGWVFTGPNLAEQLNEKYVAALIATEDA